MTTDIDGLRYSPPLMTPITDLGLSIRLSMFELRETGDWDLFLGPPERARAETGGANQWVKAEGTLRVSRVNQVTPAFLRYPLSVFNKNSTLNATGGVNQWVKAEGTLRVCQGESSNSRIP